MAKTKGKGSGMLPHGRKQIPGGKIIIHTPKRQQASYLNRYKRIMKAVV